MADPEKPKGGLRRMYGKKDGKAPPADKEKGKHEAGPADKIKGHEPKPGEKTGEPKGEGDGGEKEKPVHERHAEERHAMHSRQETERRDMHGNHREEHRKMHHRHEKEHKDLIAKQEEEMAQSTPAQMPPTGNTPTAPGAGGQITAPNPEE